MKNKFILLVEDEKLVRDSIIRDFKKPIDDKKIGLFKGNVSSTDSAKRAFKLYRKNYYDLIILDLRLREGDGMDLLIEIREQDKLTPILVLSGHAEDEDHHVIGKHPYNYFFNKAFTDIEEGNPRFEQCLKCLREGEENFEKTHRVFYLPPVLTNYLFDKEAAYGRAFSPRTKEELLQYFRDPQRGFKGDGIVRWFDQIGNVVSRDIKIITSELLSGSSGVNFKGIIERVRGVYSLETMEHFLSMEPGYREHFVHQLQNFLIGCAVYNTFKSRINPYIKQIFEESTGQPITNEEVLPLLFEISWYLTSLFHDCGYPVQYYNELFTHYFKKNFLYRFSPRLINTEELIVNEGLDHYFDSIADDFWSDSERREEFRVLLVHQFKVRNHAIHSSVALRKLIRYNEYGEEFSKLFNSVYSAIAMHDWGIWSHAKAVEDFLERNKVKLRPEFKFRYNLDFLAHLERNPLLHILILVDAIQNWGRGIGKRSIYSIYRLELIDVRIEKEDSIDFLTFEINVREGANPNTRAKVFCEFCRTFKTLSVILGSNSLPVKIVLNKGLTDDNPVVFKLGIGDIIDCKDTEGCPRKKVNS